MFFERDCQYMQWNTYLTIHSQCIIIIIIITSNQSKQQKHVIGLEIKHNIYNFLHVSALRRHIQGLKNMKFCNYQHENLGIILIKVKVKFLPL